MVINFLQVESCSKSCLSLENRSLDTSKQPKPNFPWTCGFHKALDNECISLNMTNENILMIGYREIDKIPRKQPIWKWGFPPLKWGTYYKLFNY